jgi:hypothetical protein
MHYLDDLMTDYIACVKTMHDWFHSAHILSKGASFSGDHVNLYGKIYEELGDILDGILEKVLGITNDEEIVCPTKIAHAVANKMQVIPTNSNKDGLMIASTALQLVVSHVQNTESFFKELETAKILSLGFNDFLAAYCNQLEGYVYLLQQRVKENLR